MNANDLYHLCSVDSASDDRMESAESNNKEEETRDTQSEVTVQERPASRPEPKNKVKKWI